MKAQLDRKAPITRGARQTPLLATGTRFFERAAADRDRVRHVLRSSSTRVATDARATHGADALERSPRHSPLAISKAGDALEREADRFAEAVTSGRVASVTGSIATSTVQRKCSACEETSTENEALLQRTSASSTALTGVPAEAVEMIGTGGAPLALPVRTYFEPLLGHDLRGVRIHTGPRASAAARSVNALAYTIGRDIVFRDGSPDLAQPAGRRLLAHELAHTVQQGMPALSEGDLVTRDGAERERRIAASVPVHGETAHITRGHTTTLARQAAPAEEETVTDEPLEPAPPPAPRFRVIPGGLRDVETIPDPLEGRPYYKQYLEPSPMNNSPEAMVWRTSRYDTRARRLARLSEPLAVLWRGGSPPDFLTEGSPASSTDADGDNLAYTPRYFHVLDALEYWVERAKNADDLAEVFFKFIPDAPIWNVLGQRPTGITLVLPRYTGGRPIPDSIDPGAVLRTETFLAAVHRRAASIPDLAKSPLAQRLEETEKMEGPRRQGACKAERLDRHRYGGGNADHNEYATLVTHGNLDELRVTTPEGISCQFDGLDLRDPRVVWEVKTLHETLTDLGFGKRGGMYSSTLLEIIDRVEWQRLKCMFVAARCGFRYQYAFDDCLVAKAMRRQWSNTPPVFYQPFRDSKPCP